jgi:thiamine-monophosphate kinase
LRNPDTSTAATISSVGERALIERVRQRAGAPPRGVTLGLGDDAATVQPARGAVDVLTTDALVEGVHFRREWTGARAIGHKALAVNLSDLAAMGATPRAVLLSLALPADFPLAAFDELVDGFVALATQTSAPLVGGNITRSPGPLVINVTVVGAVHPRHVLTRAGARAGDELFVTGTVGGAAAGLAMLEAEGRRPAAVDAPAAACVERYESPAPRLVCGQQVARNRAASACIDLSDGLADGARQIAQASRTGVVLDAAAIPVEPGAARWATARGQRPWAFALAGGEDYELLFAVPRRRQRAFDAVMRRCQGLPVTRIGRLTSEPGGWVETDGGHREALGAGFTHF